ncbi:hypothetical protein Fmac_015437 [Flemingia macrophylla]|uniref:S1 motif domain-containing protein n=1 Tax=Flemingia macrophylla TaxID=520843 RepID=A0ABD1MEK6_9FABA
MLGPSTKARCTCPACLLRCLAQVAYAAHAHHACVANAHHACVAHAPSPRLSRPFDFEIKQVGEPIEVRITEWNAKGLLTRIEGLRAFLPKGELVKRVNSFTELKENILVNWNTEDQPIDNAGALLNRFLGRVARNMNIFPISYQSWRKIPKDYKEDVLRNTIQVKFEVDSDGRAKYIFKSLNTKWSEYRQQLWQQRDDGTRNRDDLITMGPEGVNKNHWASFVDYRLSSRIKEQELGRKVSRGEVWIATHKHGNGDFVNDDATEISEKIQAYESNTSSLSQDISTEDSLAHALGNQEHYGRV